MGYSHRKPAGKPSIGEERRDAGIKMSRLLGGCSHTFCEKGEDDTDLCMAHTESRRSVRVTECGRSSYYAWIINEPAVTFTRNHATNQRIASWRSQHISSLLVSLVEWLLFRSNRSSAHKKKFL